MTMVSGFPGSGVQGFWPMASGFWLLATGQNQIASSQ
jgi:hypothetical protein